MTAAFEQYWKKAVAPVWPGLRRVLTADLAYRADELATGGLQALLNRLHPTVSFDGQALNIDKPRYNLVGDAGPDGLVLVPASLPGPMC